MLRSSFSATAHDEREADRGDGAGGELIGCHRIYLRKIHVNIQ